MCLFHRKDLNEYRSALCPKPKQSLLQPHVYIHTHTRHTKSNRREEISEIPFLPSVLFISFSASVQRTKGEFLNQLKEYNMFEAKQVHIIENCFPFHNYPHIWGKWKNKKERKTVGDVQQYLMKAWNKNKCEANGYYIWRGQCHSEMNVNTGVCVCVLTCEKPIEKERKLRMKRSRFFSIHFAMLVNGVYATFHPAHTHAFNKSSLRFFFSKQIIIIVMLNERIILRRISITMELIWREQTELNECKAQSRERQKKVLLKGGDPLIFAKEIYSIYNLLFSNSAQIFYRVQLTTIPRNISRMENVIVQFQNFIQVQLFWFYWSQAIHHGVSEKRIEFIRRNSEPSIMLLTHSLFVNLFIVTHSQIRAI